MTSTDPLYDYPFDDEGIAEREAQLGELIANWDHQVITSGDNSEDKAVLYSRELSEANRISELYYHSEAFYKEGRTSEALIFMKVFVESLPNVQDSQATSALARILLWRGLYYAGEGKFQEAIDEFIACDSMANNESEIDQAVSANALFWRARIAADIAYATRVDPKERNNLSDAAIKLFEELDQRFKASAVRPVRAVLARTSYYLGDLRSLNDELDAAITAFDTARNYSQNLDGYFGEGFREICAMRSAALRAVRVPPPAAESAYARANLQYLKSINESDARKMARIAALATAHGRRVDAHFPAMRAKVKSLFELFLVPLEAQRIVRRSKSEAAGQEHYLKTLEEEARSRHESAARHIRECQVSAKPLVLFLRNFGFGTRIQGNEPPRTSSASEAFDRRILEYFTRLLGPIVLVSDKDTTDADVELPADAMVLYLSDDSWETTVRGLIRLASLIIINAPFFTDSLAAELKIIEDEKQSDVTILIAQELDDQRLKVAKIFAGQPDRVAIPITPEDFKDRVAAVVKSSESPSAIESSAMATDAIAYVRSSIAMSIDERFLHLARRWEAAGRLPI